MKYVLYIFLINTLYIQPISLRAQQVTTESTVSIEDKDFIMKLNIMLNNIDNSIKILKEQIIQNQSAPLIADLYLQLANLYIKKANTLYYIQMEKNKNTKTKKLDPVINAQKEGIKIYQHILRLFPTFEKKVKVMYLMAAAYKAMYDSINFIKEASKLTKTFPNTEYAIKTHILIADHLYSQNAYNEALSNLKPVIQSNYIYEKNLARYKAGLCYLRLEKFTNALTIF